ncbi:hypothetical protein [Gilliamella sp. wkB112]|uniref:hypothetical protein n=1 Tax=Gilliamella sp. wkB112 TaxID=3120257 RepID=UPI00080E46A0|nr:hypothetical protein [Gilliamella apicola]OCG02131.1 hypothetical protein A9G12_10425 [Gilliamella apicola]
MLKKFILLTTLLPFITVAQEVPKYVQKAENFLVDFYAKRDLGETEEHIAKCGHFQYEGMWIIGCYSPAEAKAKKFTEPKFFSIQNNNDVYGFSMSYLNYRSKVVSFVIDNVKIDDAEDSVDIGKLTDKLDNLNLFSSH